MTEEFVELYKARRLDLLTQEEVNYIIKENKLDTNKISDGYHTFGELYEHRTVLYINLCKLVQRKTWTQVWRSKRHADGSEIPGWFIMGVGIDKGSQVTYHLGEEKWRDTEFASTYDFAPPFDGHSSADVLKRLNTMLSFIK